MCGIAGFFQTKYDALHPACHTLLSDKLTAMKQAIKHRGPDDDDIFLNGFGGFAHTRLSIRDILGGHQPMTGHYQNRTATIVYNGEIYNTEELQLRLAPYHPDLKTTGDTEIILYSYLVFGPSVFRDLNGIYAFAIYENDTMMIVRDHIGVKPLFYYLDDTQFVFSSEPKGIFAYGILPEIDKDSWGEVLGLGPAHTPGSGIFQGLKEVLPGHYLAITADATKQVHVTDVCYWKLKSHRHGEDYKTTVDHCNNLLVDSIRRQMVSDIPICTFLSGGLDSSLVSAIVQKELGEKKLNTYSFDFAGNDKNFQASAFQSSQDRPFVDIMTRHIGSHHTYLECDNQNQIDCLFDAVLARDMPCMADVESSMLYFCRQVARECKVTLTGECADEIFGGYPWFHRDDMLNQTTFPWSYDMSARTMLFRQDFLDTLDLDAYVQNAYAQSVSECPVWEEDTLAEQNRRKISWLNVRWFMMTLLNRMDRCSMYSGLEARVPYADYRILEYVFNIPWEYKCHNGQTKSLLVECGKNYLPPEVLYRKKSPYPKTYDPNYEKLLGQMVLEELSVNTHLADLVDRTKLEQFIASPKDYGKPWYGQLMAGPQMLAYLLQIGFWMKTYHL